MNSDCHMLADFEAVVNIVCRTVTHQVTWGGRSAFPWSSTTCLSTSSSIHASFCFFS